jgi:Na+/proline symporter
MIRIAKSYRITSIADFIASRYGKSHLLGRLVTIITVVGIIPYIALQLKAVSMGYAVLTGMHDEQHHPMRVVHWFQDSTLYVAMILGIFTILFGARHLDATERHEGMVAAIAFESVVKLVAFLAWASSSPTASSMASATSSGGPTTIRSWPAADLSGGPASRTTAAGSR